MSILTSTGSSLLSLTGELDAVAGNADRLPCRWSRRVKVAKVALMKDAPVQRLFTGLAASLAVIISSLFRFKDIEIGERFV